MWHVAGPPDFFDAEGRDHAAGARRCATPAREVPPPLPGDWSPRSGYQAGQVLARMTGVTAVFAANDQMALGLLRALHEQGRRVPDDISLVGFDDIPESAYFSPPLTTVRQDFAEVGRRSLAAALAQIESGQPAHERAVIPPTLVVRDSVAPPSTSGRR